MYLCLERRQRQRPIFAAPDDCGTALRTQREMYNSVLPVKAAIARFVPVIRVDEAFCSTGRCVVADDGKPLYLDRGHLSQHGSLYMARRLRLSEQILALAR